MNTPPTKKRYKMTAVLGEGSWTHGCTFKPVLIQLGAITAYWAHVEATMQIPFAELSGSNDLVAAAVLLNGIVSASARVETLKRLLERTPRNIDADDWYGEYIKRLSTLISRRNKYVHGTWYTMEGTDRVVLASTSGYKFDDLENAREVTETELRQFLTEVSDFIRWQNERHSIRA